MSFNRGTFSRILSTIASQRGLSFRRRHPEPILAPEEDYELRGEVNRIVFGCGICVVEGTCFIYYGGADSVVCVATIENDELSKLF